MDRLLAPLQGAAELNVTRVALDAGTPYPYPWPFWQFLDAFPETVLLDPPPLRPLPLAADQRFDLVILGYPVWFLSPAPALTAFLQHPVARTILRDTPVVTVTACRNMWLMAQETVKRLLLEIGSRHLDHVALIDQGGTLATFITTPRWLLTGRKSAFWGLPAAGVSEKDIGSCERFGAALRGALQANAERGDRPMLAGLRACEVNVGLIASERIGLRSFRLWGRLLCALGRPGAPLRRVALALYLVFLLAAIVTVVPLTLAVKALLQRMLRNRLAALKSKFEAPSGSDGARLKHDHV